ncbi:NUDIX hydrolase [Streptacidiphilus rugosus]|uniref:NUDIX hydrolase n=1 Tax=Streptacidiphilus rugosus TaxID=405783 RepID=UPI002FBDD2C5
MRDLHRLLPGSHVFDPEDISRLLRRILPVDALRGPADCQDLLAWRRLVPDALSALSAQLGPDVPLLVPMALHRQEYRDEIFGTLASRRLEVHHILLHVDETILRAHLDADRVDAYRAALDWLRRDTALVPASELTPLQAAQRVVELVRSGGARVPIVQDPVARGDTVAAAVLLFDEADRVLLVDPVYKPGWEFPGGVVETGEAPSAAAVREAEEELGLALTEDALRLLAVDWEPNGGPRSGGLRLVFDGGRVSAAARARLRLPAAELRDWRFAGPEEWPELLAPNKLARLRAALSARAVGRTLYLEAGQEG